MGGALFSGHLCGALLVPVLNRKKLPGLLNGPMFSSKRVRPWTLMLWPSLCFAFALLTESSPFHHVFFFLLFFKENIRLLRTFLPSCEEIRRRRMALT